MLGISKRENKELRKLFIHAARAVMWRDKTAGKLFEGWLLDLNAESRLMSRLLL